MFFLAFTTYVTVIATFRDTLRVRADQDSTIANLSPHQTLWGPSLNVLGYDRSPAR